MDFCVRFDAQLGAGPGPEPAFISWNRRVIASSMYWNEVCMAVTAVAVLLVIVGVYTFASKLPG